MADMNRIEVAAIMRYRKLTGGPGWIFGQASALPAPTSSADCAATIRAGNLVIEKRPQKTQSIATEQLR
jgi:hypothetical protein